MAKKPTYEELEQRVKELEKASIVHRQIEEALRESEDNFRGLYEGSRDAIGLSDMDGRLLETNKAFQELTGYSAQELSKMTYQDLTPKKWGKIEAEVVKESVDKKNFPLFEKEYRRKDGTIVPIELSGFISRSEESRSVGMWAFIRDISDRKKTEDKLEKHQDYLEELVKERTAKLSMVNEHLKLEIAARKQAEDALRESEQRLLKAQEVARMGFLDWNLKTNEMYWSDEIYNLYGINRQHEKSNIDRTMELVHPDDLAFVEKHLDMAIQGVKKYDIDHRKLRPDGKTIWLHAQAELVRDAEGNPERLLGTVVDITDRKRAEQDLLKERTLLKTIIDKIPVMLTHYNPDAKMIYLNKEFEKIVWLENRRSSRYRHDGKGIS